MIRLWKNRLLGNPVRVIPNTERIFHLTFDDGPDTQLTPRLLDLLDEASAKATFFIVAEKALKHVQLVREMIKRGHALGNHSLDHRYGSFFRGREVLRAWIQESEKKIEDLCGERTVGFRPPAGVRTPELASVLREINLPLVLWKARFFDAIFALKLEKFQRKMESLDPGSIVLLHGVQKEKNRDLFIRSLGSVLKKMWEEKTQFQKLTRESCEAAVHLHLFKNQLSINGNDQQSDRSNNQ